MNITNTTENRHRICGVGCFFVCEGKQMKETAAPDGRMLSAIGSKARDATVSNTNISQNGLVVNTPWRAFGRSHSIFCQNVK